MNKKKYISKEEAIRLLGISRKQTLDTTLHFPKPVKIDGDIFYSKKRLQKFLNIDNLDEPFIFAEEAATLLGVDVARLRYLASKELIPFYRLKTLKGSGYMFKKSELESMKSNPTIIRSIAAVNAYMKADVLKNVFSILINKHFEKDSRTYRILKGHFIFDKSYQEIGDELGITRERIRQILNKEVERISSGEYIANPSDVIDLKQTIARQKREVEYWKNIAQSQGGKNAPACDFDMFEKIYFLLSKRLTDYRLSVRAHNVLQSNNFKTVADIMEFCFDTEDYYSKLRALRNLGRKTYEEIRDLVEKIRREISNEYTYDVADIFKPIPSVLGERLREKINENKK